MNLLQMGWQIVTPLILPYFIAYLNEGSTEEDWWGWVYVACVVGKCNVYPIIYQAIRKFNPNVVLNEPHDFVTKQVSTTNHVWVATTHLRQSIKGETKTSQDLKITVTTCWREQW